MYKNMKAICGLSDHRMVLALATLDMKTALGRKFMEHFPEFFTEKEQAGPYPLSLMREAAQAMGLRDGNNTNGADYIVSYDSVPPGIPFQTFDKFGNNAADLNGPILPKEISPDAKQGEVVTWQGAQFVVLENNDSCEELSIAPAELVHVDIDV